MDFEWDGAKADANRRKHGIRFEVAVEVFFDPRRYELADDREDYGEARFVTVGRVGRRLLTVVHAEKDDRIRIISAREATRDERERYHTLPP
jgi:uncharacterized DUF497 family protein